MNPEIEKFINEAKKTEQKVVTDVKTFRPLNWLVGIFCKFNWKTFIDIVIILIPIALIYIYFNGRTPKEVTEVLVNNKKIERKVDSLKMDNEFIVQRMYEMEKNQSLFFDAINKNTEKIEENNKKIDNLKQIYNAKIKSINGYTVSQLDSFFTNRYQKYYNR